LVGESKNLDCDDNTSKLATTKKAPTLMPFDTANHAADTLSDESTNTYISTSLALMTSGGNYYSGTVNSWSPVTKSNDVGSIESFDFEFSQVGATVCPASTPSGITIVKGTQSDITLYNNYNLAKSCSFTPFTFTTSGTCTNAYQRFSYEVDFPSNLAEHLLISVDSDSGQVAF
jgi:hypothetical protein